MAECLKLKRLLRISKCWSVDEAAWVLEAFDINPMTLLYWRRLLTWTDAGTIRVAEHGLACEVEIDFTGGPDGVTSYDGNFAMFAVDRVLASGKDWDWLLSFNTDTTTHIGDQHLIPFTTGQYDYCEDERATEFIEVKGRLFPLNDAGRQVSKPCREPEEKDDGIVRRWTSSGSVVGSGENDGKLD